MSKILKKTFPTQNFSSQHFSRGTLLGSDFCQIFFDFRYFFSIFVVKLDDFSLVGIADDEKNAPCVFSYLYHKFSGKSITVNVSYTAFLSRLLVGYTLLSWIRVQFNTGNYIRVTVGVTQAKRPHAAAEGKGDHSSGKVRSVACA